MTCAATSNQFDALKPVQAFSPSVINFLQGQASYIAYVSQKRGQIAPARDPAATTDVWKPIALDLAGNGVQVSARGANSACRNLFKKPNVRYINTRHVSLIHAAHPSHWRAAA